MFQLCVICRRKTLMFYLTPRILAVTCQMSVGCRIFSAACGLPTQYTDVLLCAKYIGRYMPEVSEILVHIASAHVLVDSLE